MNVQELWIPVTVHRQIDLSVTHRRLCLSRRNAAFTEQRPERMPQRMNIHSPPTFIAFCNTSRLSDCEAICKTKDDD
jgi:hypothetical protein